MIIFFLVNRSGLTSWIYFLKHHCFAILIYDIKYLIMFWLNILEIMNCSISGY